MNAFVLFEKQINYFKHMQIAWPHLIFQNESCPRGLFYFSEIHGQDSFCDHGVIFHSLISMHRIMVRTNGPVGFLTSSMATHSKIISRSTFQYNPNDHDEIPFSSSNHCCLAYVVQQSVKVRKNIFYSWSRLIG